MKVIKLAADEINKEYSVTFENGETFDNLRLINAIEIVAVKGPDGKNILEPHVRNSYLKNFRN